MASESEKIPVLIAGAGPTGLVLALWLARAGVKVRIIDELLLPGTTSRAMVVHARTLELYHQLGIAEETIARGIKFHGANLWIGGERRARIPIGDLGAGLSPYPYVLVFPQDRHEELLIEELGRAGVNVERGTQLLSFSEEEGEVRARLRLQNGREETCVCTYLAGCDGARSKVRETLGTGFPGGTYPEMYYVADAIASGPVMNGELNLAIDEADFVAVFPMQGQGAGRFIGQVHQPGKEWLRWEDVSPKLFRELDVRVKEIKWFSTYHVHHRVSSQFSRGRAFLLGDAAHIHSPVGGQGMNTGIGDAVNLAWKLAEVLQGRASASLLDSYEPERIAFARKLVATTDRMFRVATSRGPIARLMRTRVVPRLVPFLMERRFAQRFAFRTISQTGITYRKCAFNAGRAGPLQGGDRLPWVESLGNFRPLEARAWQLHVYGAGAPGLEALMLPVHRFPWTEGAARAGLCQGAAYLVRPDGYIGCVSSGGQATEIDDYLRKRGLRP